MADPSVICSASVGLSAWAAVVWPVGPEGSALAHTASVASERVALRRPTGELVVAEMVPQVPGQMNMDGTQQEAPKLLKLVQHG